MTVRKRRLVGWVVRIDETHPLVTFAAITPVVLMREWFQPTDDKDRASSSVPSLRMVSLVAVVRYLCNERCVPSPMPGTDGGGTAGARFKLT